MKASFKSFLWLILLLLPLSSLGNNDIGFIELHQKNYPLAFAEFKKAAKAGNTNAMSNLGYMYNFGLGTPINNAKAFYWYSKAAALGDGGAMYNLGGMYYNGQYVKPSEEKAFLLFQKAAKKGVVKAYYNVGYMYLQGIGVEQNTELGFEYLLHAARLGNSHAILLVGDCYEHGIGVNRSFQKAYDWYATLAYYGNEKINERAAVKLHNLERKVSARYNERRGQRYLHGPYKDYNKSYNYFQKAKLLGNPKAAQGLAELYAKLTPQQIHQVQEGTFSMAEVGIKAPQPSIMPPLQVITLPTSSK